MRLIFLFVFVLVALWFLTPGATPTLSDQAKAMIAALKTFRSLQGLVQSEPCTGTGSFSESRYPLRNSCRFATADTNVAMSWSKKTGGILSVRLSKSVPKESRDDVRMLPVASSELPGLYRTLCPDLPLEHAAFSTSPLEKLSQAQWSRWDGNRRIEAKADEKLAFRDVMIADFPMCRLRLVETNEGPTFRSTLSLGY